MSSSGTETISTIHCRILSPCQSACPLVGTQKTVSVPAETCSSTRTYFGGYFLWCLWKTESSPPTAIGGEVFTGRYLESGPSLQAEWAGAPGASWPWTFPVGERQLFPGEETDPCVCSLYAAPSEVSKAAFERESVHGCTHARQE